MKTKNFITVLSLTLGLLVSAFAFTACGSDDNDNNNNGTSSNPLVGTWIAEKEEKGVMQHWEITFNPNRSLGQALIHF